LTRWTETQYQDYKIKTTDVLTDKQDAPDPGPESRLQRKIEAWCREHGYPCFHDRSRGKNAPGWPDLTIVMRNRVVFIELKSAKGVLRKEQKQKRLEFYHLGHSIHVVKSFKRFLEIVNDA